MGEFTFCYKYTPLEVTLPYPTWSEVKNSIKTSYVKGFKYNLNNKNELVKFEFEINYLYWGFYTSSFVAFYPHIPIENIGELLKHIEAKTDYYFQVNEIAFSINDSLMYRYHPSVNILDIHCCQCYWSLMKSCGNRHLWIKVTPSLIEALKQYLTIRKQ